MGLPGHVALLVAGAAWRGGARRVSIVTMAKK